VNRESAAQTGLPEMRTVKTTSDRIEFDFMRASVADGRTAPQESTTSNPEKPSLGTTLGALLHVARLRGPRTEPSRHADFGYFTASAKSRVRTTASEVT
jgi:hypothetical protein